MPIGFLTRRPPLIVLAVILMVAATRAALPEPQGYVSDFAAVLDAATREPAWPASRSSCVNITS